MAADVLIFARAQDSEGLMEAEEAEETVDHGVLPSSSIFRQSAQVESTVNR